MLKCMLSLVVDQVFLWSLSFAASGNTGIRQGLISRIVAAYIGLVQAEGRLVQAKGLDFSHVLRP